MRGGVAVTDPGWWEFLRGRPDLDEVNFWRPGAQPLKGLVPGEPLFFKLKGAADAIAGFGLVSRYERMPVWLAWNVFGQANGVSTERALLDRLGRLASGPMARDTEIGCIAVVGAVFFEPPDWVARPADWSRNIVSMKRYDLTHGEGRRIWNECLERAAPRMPPVEWAVEALDRERTGKPQVVLPRLGQASFRLAVLGAYGRACAVTREHSLPVLDAAHIRPWGQGGGHDLANGLPLRSDLHRLFDLGFVTVLPDRTLAVSPRLREDFDNGRTYYALEGRPIATPADPRDAPDPALLAWHNDVVFRG